MNPLPQAILDNPEDDALRLVYSDWLEENGHEERAEFIRVQIELYHYQDEREWLEQMPTEKWIGTDKSKALLFRLKPLVDRHVELCHKYVRDLAPWSREFAQGIFGENWLQLCASWQWGWARGFVDEIRCSTADWITHGDAILAAHPVTTVRLSDDPTAINAFKPFPWQFHADDPPSILENFRVKFAGQDYLAGDIGITSMTGHRQDRNNLFHVRWPRVKIWEFNDHRGDVT